MLIDKKSNNATFQLNGQLPPLKELESVLNNSPLGVQYGKWVSLCKSAIYLFYFQFIFFTKKNWSLIDSK